MGAQRAARLEVDRVSALRAVTPDREPLTMDAMFARIDAYIQRNQYPLVAAERVIADLCAEGRQDELLTMFWPPPLYAAWEAFRKEPGHAARSKAAQAGGHARAEQRRQALKATSSRLESLVQIGNEWKRLGDMTRAECLKAASTQKQQALSIAHRARWYHAIAQQLPEGVTVRATLNEESLSALYQEASR